MKRLIKKLILSGGGVKGIAYIGFIKYLEELKSKVKKERESVNKTTNENENESLELKLEEVCCVSVGSLIGLLYIVGYTYEELYEEIICKELGDLKNFRIKNFFEKYGMDNGKMLMTWMETLLLKKGVSKDITLREIWSKYGINFRVVVTNVNKYAIEIFDYIKNPNLKAIKAVRMSTSIPFIFCAERYNGNVYIDGGVLNNYPIKLYSDNELDNILGCKLVTKGEFDDDVCHTIDSFDSYLVNLIGCMFANKERETTLAYKYMEHTICIHAYKITQAVNFTLTQEDKQSLINMGYDATREYFENNRDNNI